MPSNNSKLKKTWRENPRPYGERFYESNRELVGIEVRLCTCGNTFYKADNSPQKFCSKVCVRKYAQEADYDYVELAASGSLEIFK